MSEDANNTSNVVVYLFLVIAVLAHLLDPLETFVTIELIMIMMYSFYRISGKILRVGKDYFDSEEKVKTLVLRTHREVYFYLGFALVIFLIYGDFIDNVGYIFSTSVLIVSSSFLLMNWSYSFSYQHLNYNRTDENKQLFSSTAANVKGFFFPLLLSSGIAILATFGISPGLGVLSGPILQYSIMIVLILFTGFFGYKKFKGNINQK